MNPKMKKGAKWLLYATVLAAIVGAIRTPAANDDKEELQNPILAKIAPSYTLYGDPDDPRTEENTGAVVYVPRKVSSDKVELVSNWNGQKGSWIGFITFYGLNTSPPYKGVFRTEYGGKILERGTCTLSPNEQGGFSISFARKGEVEGYKGDLMPNWW